MLTAVQLRAGPFPSATIVYGTPCRELAGIRGPIALFKPERLVAYRLDGPRTRLWVFRTPAEHLSEGALIPGVSPAVSLLLEVRTSGRATLVARLFAYLAKAQREPERLPDGFWLRIATVLAGRLPSRKVTQELLRHVAT